MNRSVTLTATDAVANVERYLAQQYAKRKVEKQRPVDGVIGMWREIVRIAIKKVGDSGESRRRQH